jgi:hypothetical protein
MYTYGTMSSDSFQKVHMEEGAHYSLGVARKVVLVLMLAVILGSFAAAGWARLERNWRSTELDQGAYLSLGLEIREGTALTDGNRHPLYPALLALFAEREWAYFTKAKMLSLAIGLTGLVAIYWICHRTFGQDVALLTTLLWSVGNEFRRYSSMAMCETLLTVLFFAAWYFTIKGFSKERYWILGGTFAGLAQLTKGTGQLFAIAFLLPLLPLYGPRVLARKGFWAFVGCYLAVTSVLMTYNYREYGNPLYNFNTTHAMWLDEWEDSYVASPEELPTLTSYWPSHSPWDIVTREWKGLKKVVRSWLIVAVIPAHPRYMRDILSSGLGLAAFLVGAIGLGCLFRRRLSLYWQEHRERIVLSLVLFVLFNALTAWYAPIAKGVRLLLPLVPILYVFMAEGLCGLGRRIGAKLAKADDRLVPTAYVAVYINLMLWVLSISGEATQSSPVDLFELDRLRNAGRDRVLAWLSEETQSGGAVIYGPSHSLPTWKYRDRITFLPIPNRMTWGELSAYIEAHAAGYALLDGETVSRRQPLFQEYFQALGKKKVDILALPDHWDLIFADEEIPCRYCIFRVNRLVADDRWRVDVGCPFGQEVRLMGYSLETDQVEPDQVGVTLYWRALQPPATRYDVLLKLISTSYKVWGQQSGPLPGLFLPLEWWKGGQIVKDRRVVEPLSAAPPGPYYVEVHVYNPSTEKWLEAEGECDLLLGPGQVSRREMPAVEDLDMDHPIGAVLGERVRLLGYNVESGFRPGDNIHLTLFWQCLEKMEQTYTVFTHLVDAEDNLVAQKDNPPVDGFYSTAKWEVGEIVRDQYDLVIPSEVPSGEYRLKVGMYLHETGERLPIYSGSEKYIVADRALGLQQVIIGP